MSDTIHLRLGSRPGRIRLSSTPEASQSLGDVYFALSSGPVGDVERLSDGSILVADSLLLQKLASIRTIQRAHPFDLDPDEDVEALIRGFVGEARRLRQARENPAASVTLEDVGRGLHDMGFRRTLTPEQTRDVGRLLTLDHGANFSVPGAGKTTSLLAVYTLLRRNDCGLKLLVVAPRNAFISWDEEVAECLGPESTVLRLTGGRDRIAALLRTEPSLVCITYQQLWLVVTEVEAFVRRNRVHLVLDESHRAKGGQHGRQGAAVLKIAPLATRRDILSGTPMPQGIQDIGPQFDFLWPGHSLGGELSRLSQGDENLFSSANALLSPLFVRTTKHELHIADPILHLERVGLGSRQLELYELLRSEAARLLRGFDRTDRAKLRALGRHVIRLIQVASNPQLLLSGLEQGRGTLGGDADLLFLLRSTLREEAAAKLEGLDSLVRRILSDQGSKVVIWTSFVENVNYLVDLYSGHNAVGIYGDIPTGDDEDLAYREARIKRFNQDPHCRMMVANPAACGEGISLHRACHHAVYLDRTFNAAHFLQSVDRIHRLGLPPDVDTHIYLLIAPSTIDEVLHERLQRKIAALGELLDDEQLKALSYDPEDVVEDVDGGLSSEDVDEIIAHLRPEGHLVGP